MIPLLLIVCFLSSVPVLECYNVSVCSFFAIGELYFYVNDAQHDNDIITDSFQYNLCHQTSYYCEESTDPLQRQVKVGSMIKKDSSGCTSLQQYSVELINYFEPSEGILIRYGDLQDNSSTQILEFRCKDNVGCPYVYPTTVFSYLDQNSVSYTIIAESIGIILMLLGFYVYKLTIILLGIMTTSVVLMAIESTFLFLPGVTYGVISDVLIITGVCGFFMGYIIIYFTKWGLFILGGWIGLIISCLLNTIAFHYINSEPHNLVFYIVLPVLVLGFGVLTILLKKSFIIFATSLLGAYISIRALSWNLGAYPNQFLYPKQYQLKLKPQLPWQFYLYMIAIFLLTGASSALQYWLFKQKMGKKKQSIDIDQHFQNMEKEITDIRQKQLVNFQEVFKKEESRPPRKLVKEIRNIKDDDSFLEYQDNFQNQNPPFKKDIEMNLMGKPKNSRKT